MSRARTPLDLTYLKMAFLIANDRSVDSFTQVGCVAANDKGELIGASYNGFPPKYEPNFDISLEENRDKKNKLIYHAEQNILLRHPKNSIHTLYLTVSPCNNCSKWIAGHGVKRVIYAKEYHRETDFKEIFKEYGVEYKEMCPLGYL